jgi:hypothetical protein
LKLDTHQEELDMITAYRENKGTETALLNINTRIRKKPSTIKITLTPLQLTSMAHSTTAITPSLKNP